MEPLLAIASASDSGLSTALLVGAITGGFAIVAALITGFLAYASRKNASAAQTAKADIDENLIEWVQKATRAEEKADLALNNERICRERINVLEEIVHELAQQRSGRKVR